MKFRHREPFNVRLFKQLSNKRHLQIQDAIDVLIERNSFRDVTVMSVLNDMFLVRGLSLKESILSYHITMLICEHAQLWESYVAQLDDIIWMIGDVDVAEEQEQVNN